MLSLPPTQDCTPGKKSMSSAERRPPQWKWCHQGLQFPYHDSQVITATSPPHRHQQQVGRCISFRAGECCKCLEPLPQFKKHFTVASPTYSPRPRTSILALRIQSQRLTMDTNAVNVSSPESSTGFPRQQRNWLVLSGHSQPWKGDRRAEKVNSDAMSVDQLVLLFAPSTSPIEVSHTWDRSGCLCYAATFTIDKSSKP